MTCRHSARRPSKNSPKVITPNNTRESVRRAKSCVGRLISCSSFGRIR
jgi:hypothetical protein